MTTLQFRAEIHWVEPIRPATEPTKEVARTTPLTSSAYPEVTLDWPMPTPPLLDTYRPTLLPAMKSATGCWPAAPPSAWVTSSAGPAPGLLMTTFELAASEPTVALEANSAPLMSRA